jgi:peptidoglycan/LPS O-acetylase OafA/YrhL
MANAAEDAGSGPERIPALDGLRGMATLLVMAHHFVLYGGSMAGTLRLDRVVSRLAYAGWIGVDVFLVLSGFLITQSLLSVQGGVAPYRRFLLRRALRTLPLHYGLLLAFLPLLAHVCSGGAEYLVLLRQQPWYRTQFVNWRIAVRGWTDCLILDHLWFTALIWQFYLLWPLLVYRLRGKGLLLLCGCLILLDPLGRYALHRMMLRVPYVLLPARIDALAIGAAIALLMRTRKVRRHLLRWAWLPAAASAAVLATVFVWKRRLVLEDPFVGTVGLSLLALFVGAVLILAHAPFPSGRLCRLLSITPLRFFGRYSYGLYVLHHPIVILLPRAGMRIEAFPTWMGSKLPGFVLFSLVAGALSTAFALLSWRFWESRFLNLRRRCS